MLIGEYTHNCAEIHRKAPIVSGRMFYYQDIIHWGVQALMLWFCHKFPKSRFLSTPQFPLSKMRSLERHIFVIRQFYEWQEAKTGGRNFTEDLAFADLEHSGQI